MKYFYIINKIIIYSDIFTYNKSLQEVTVTKLGDNEFDITGTIPYTYKGKRNLNSDNVTLELDSNDRDFGYHLFGSRGKRFHLWT